MIVELIDEAKKDVTRGLELYIEIDPDHAPEFSLAIARNLIDLEKLIFPHPKRFGLHCAFSKKYPFSIYSQFDGTTLRVIGILDQISSPKKHARLLKRRT